MKTFGDMIVSSEDKTEKILSRYILNNSKYLDVFYSLNDKLLDLNLNSDLTIAIRELTNINAFILSSDIDLIISLKKLLKSSSNIEEAFFIKNIYLIIYESTKTYLKYQGKLGLSFPYLNSKLKDLGKEIRTFKKKYKYDTDICYIRNNIIGHINHDFKIYYDTINLFDKKHVIEMSLEFLRIIKKVGKITIEVLDIINRISKTQNQQ